MVLLNSLSRAQELKCGVAVRIILNKDFEFSFAQVASTQLGLCARLQEDICASLCIPTTGVHVILICVQRGKLMAEVVFREPEDQLDQDISVLAEELICKVKDSQSAFRTMPLGRFAEDAEIHGLVSFCVCETVVE